jgi:hypothetical protein
MFLPSLSRLRRTLARSPRAGRRRAPGKPSAAFRPRLEALEDRTVPSTVTWVNPGGGDWDTAANWSDGTTHRLPGPGDDAVISTPGITVTHSAFSANDAVNSLTSAATLAVSGGTLALGAVSEVSALTLSGGTLTGGGNLTVDNALVWTGGTMSGPGHTVLNGTAEFGKGGSNGPALSGRLLDNFGTAAVDSGATLVLSNGAVLTNEAGATLTLAGTGSLVELNTQPGQLDNAGQLIKAGAGTAFANVPLDNPGTIDIQGGTLFVGRGLTNEGTFAVEGGAEGDLASDITSSTTSSGDFSLAGGGRLTISSAVTLQSGATAEVAAGAQVVIAGSLTQQGGATVALASGGLLSVTSNYALADGAAVSGPGAVQVFGGQLTANGDVAVDNLAVSGGTVAVAAGGQLDVQALTLTGGMLSGAGDLTVENSLLCTGGRMSGSGHTVLNGTAEVGKGGSGGLGLSGRLLDNFGTAAVDSGAFVVLDGGAVLTNEAGATLTLAGTGSLADFTAQPGQLNNAGQLIKAGAGTAVASVPLDNTGTIDIQGGTLLVERGLTNEGTFAVEGGAEGDLVSGTGSGDFSLAGGGRLTITPAGSFTLRSGATAEVAAGAQVVIEGSLTQQGGATVTLAPGSLLQVGPYFAGSNYVLGDGAAVSGPGAVQVNGPGSQLIASGNVAVDNLAMSDGTVAVAVGGQLDVQALTLTGGALSGAGDVTVEASLLWTGGTMVGSGHTVLNGTAEFGGVRLRGPSLSGRLLDNFGTAVMDSGANVFLGGGAVLTNEAGATFTLRGNDTLILTAQPGQISNAGQLIKAGAGHASIFVPLDNTGTIDIQQGGALGVGLTNEGTVTVEKGAGGEFEGGTSSGDFSLAGGSGGLTLAGPFTLLDGATAEVATNAVLDMEGTITQQGGAAVTLAPGSLLQVGQSLPVASYTLEDGATVSGPGTVRLFRSHGGLTARGNVTVDNLEMTNDATVTVAAGGNLDVQTFTLSAGLLTGAGDLTVEASLLWAGGAMSGPGHTILNGTAEFGGFPFRSPLLSGRLLDNFGTAVVDNAITLGLSNSAVFNNQAGATLTLQGTGSLGGSFATGNINNAGLLLKTGAGTQATVSVPMTNSGTVEIVGGVLHIDGSYTQTGAGSLTVHLAGLNAGSQYGQLQVNGLATLGGTLNVQLDNGFTPSVGNSFRILTFSTRSGDFATENFPDLGSLFFNPVYDSSGLNLVVQSS